MDTPSNSSGVDTDSTDHNDNPSSGSMYEQQKKFVRCILDRDFKRP
jgi:hypothetical protein